MIEKEVIFNYRKMPMSKKFAIGLIILSSSLLMTHCSRPLWNKEINFGILAAQRDLWEEAVFRWQKAVLASPDSVAAHNNLAVAYERKGLWEEAKKEYELALKLDPKNSYIKANYENFKKNYEGSDKEPPEKEKAAKEKKDEKK
jgi:Flp pilus assembly protein TadD